MLSFNTASLPTSQASFQCAVCGRVSLGASNVKKEPPSAGAVHSGLELAQLVEGRASLRESTLLFPV